MKDPASNQMVSAKVFGTFKYQGDPGVERQLSQKLLRAINHVVCGKIIRNEIALTTLESSLPHLHQEIIAQCDASALGAQLGDLQLQVNIDLPQAAPQNFQSPQEAMEQALERRAEEELSEHQNREVRGRVRIGGVWVEGNSKDGINTEGIKSQLKDKVKSEIIWYGAAALIVLLVLGGLAGLGVYIWGQIKSRGQPAVASGEVQAATWDGKSPFRCGGQQRVRLQNVTAKLSSGAAIKAGGACELELEGVNIEAPTGITAGGTAKVTVVGGRVKGSKLAAKAVGSGQIIFKGTEVVGKTKTLGPKAKIQGP